MAKITKMPSMAIVNGFKGKIDFYIHDGQPCARMWPRSPGRDRAPGVQAQWPAWTWATKNWNSLSTEVQLAYKQMASGTYLTGRDIFTKSFISADFITKI